MTRAVGAHAEPVELIPPVPQTTVVRVVGAGVVLCGTAAVLGLVGDGGPSLMSTARLVLVAVGALAAACGLSLRPRERVIWAAAGLAGWLAAFGLPAHWDSARLVAGVLGSLGLAGAGLLSVPRGVRLGVLSVAVLFHFGAILTATTWPTTYNSPPPWVTEQAANRLYMPYYKFMYLSNAYHFYSPDPGPASHLFFLLQYETDEDDVDEKTGQVKVGADGAPAKKRVAEWVDMPKRRTQFRDPLGMTYYRRLSLTELVSYSIPGNSSPFSLEKANAIQRRRDNELGLNGKPVPGAIVGNEVDLSQYRVPHSHIRKMMLPSYARHIAQEYSGPRRTSAGKVVNYTVTRVKLFRVEHRVVQPNQFLKYDDPYTRLYHPRATPPTMGDLNPYHPSTYYPYLVGEYDRTGNLINPDDPLLYWLVPIQYLPNGPRDQKSYRDYMSEYAGHEFIWEGKE